MKALIKQVIKDSLALKEAFFTEYADRIVELSRHIADAFNEGGKLLLFGNGGSATDASHIAAEFVNRFKKERPGLPAIALNTDMAVITSIANDYDYSEVFVRQLRSLAHDGDTVIAISTSGGSKNVLKAMDAAKKKGITVVAFTGAKGKRMASMADYAFVVPSTDTPRIQEVHITLGHIICELVEKLLFEFAAK
jgi:D-sedoheptulose 7-phosphate isomerase